MSDLTHVSLFTGIGGADLAAEWAGFDTVLQVERDDYCRRVLERHWPDVPRITDVREVHDDERWRQPTVISGGFPCQPFSAAGKRRGADDDRYLWPELLRIVEELRPTWVVGENVSGLLSIRDGMEIDDMLASLEARAYEPWILHYPAAGVGAPHKRDRVFIVARNSERHGGDTVGCFRGGENTNTGRVCEDVADAELSGRNGRTGELRSRRRGESENGSQWQSEPDVGRVANGIPRRVDRLRALGNAIVPQQIYPIFEAIAHTEQSTNE